MKALAATLLALSLAGCAGGPRMTDRQRAFLGSAAEPSEVIAAELAFARMAREKGQWTAFREFATVDAILLRPDGVIGLHEWLADTSDPPESGRWQPHSVWSSCDGSLAVTRGAYSDALGTTGRFATVWERQPNREYRFVFTFGSALDAPMVEPQMIEAIVADCARPIELRASINTAAIEAGSGRSADGTLVWRYALDASGTRTFAASILRDGQFVDVVSDANGPSETDPE